MRAEYIRSAKKDTRFLRNTWAVGTILSTVGAIIGQVDAGFAPSTIMPQPGYMTPQVLTTDWDVLTRIGDAAANLNIGLLWGEYDGSKYVMIHSPKELIGAAIFNIGMLALLSFGVIARPDIKTAAEKSTKQALAESFAKGENHRRLRKRRRKNGRKHHNL